MSRRVSRAAVVAGVALVVAGAAAGGVLGGRTLALWRAAETVTAAVPVGVAVLGIGAPAVPGALGSYATSDGQVLSYAFGPEQAATLAGTGPDGGAVAVPLQVDSLAQGSRELTYTVTPEIDGGVFGASTWELYRVASAGACTTGTTQTVARTSTPWSGAYAPGTALRSEYWCLVARYVPVTGTHEGTATVSGTPELPDGGSTDTATSSSTWTADVAQVIDPTQEPVHHLRVDWATGRPGAAP